MRAALALIALVALIALATPASADHGPHTLPKTDEDPSLAAALGWLGDGDRVDGDGCALDVEGNCDLALTKWYAIAAAHAGADPGAWPTEDRAVLDHLLANADDLRDPALEDCESETGSSCSSDRAFSHAKNVLALRAAGEDPRSVPLPGGGTRDLVADLLDTHQDGLGEFGRSERANDDIWALTALTSVGYDGPEVDDAVARVEAAQAPDGGVRHTEGRTPDVDTTAAAVWALAPHDRERAVDDALGFLRGEQVDRGEDAGCWPLGGAFDTGANAASTAWAINALAAAREDPVAWNANGTTPIECLLDHQADGGGFRHTGDSAVQRLPTYQAAVALAWAPYGAVTEPPTPTQRDDEATRGETTRTGLADGFLREGQSAHDPYTWTPQTTGERSFHGVAWAPARPATVDVTVYPPDGSEDRHDDEDASAAAGPEVHLPDRVDAERAVPLDLEVEATRGEAPVVEVRVDWGDGNATGWQASPRFDHAYERLGEHALTATARDAEGRTGQATATVAVRDAAPRIELDLPAAVNRTEPFPAAVDAVDPDGPAPDVTWTAPNATAEGAEATLTLHEPGLHEVQATARDAAGNAATATGQVRALNRAPAVPEVTPRVAPANDTVTLRADVDDPDGDAVQVAWHHAGEDEPAAWGGQHRVDTDAPGTLNLTLNATDPHGAWTRSTVAVPVEDQPDDERRAPPPVDLDARAAAEPPAPEEPRSAPDELPHVDLPDRIEVPAGTPHLVQVEAEATDATVDRVDAALGQPLPARGTDPATVRLPALPAGTYTLTAHAVTSLGHRGPPTNATVLVEAPAEGTPLEADAAPDAGEPEAANPTPLPIGAALAAGLSAAALRRGRP
jgi:hypothetical protein